jgi:hypothetical protein
MAAEFQFGELPRIKDDDDLRRIHREEDLYFVKRGGVAHTSLACVHLEPDQMVDQSAWRVATGVQVRRLQVGWCQDCCD